MSISALGAALVVGVLVGIHLTDFEVGAIQKARSKKVVDWEQVFAVDQQRVPKSIIGDQLRIGSMSFAVDDAPRLNEKAEGTRRFVIIPLIVWNESESIRYFDSRNFTLLDSQGRTYAPLQEYDFKDPGYWMPLSYGDIKPDDSTSGYIVFEINLNAKRLVVEIMDVPYLAAVDRKQEHVGYIELKL